MRFFGVFSRTREFFWLKFHTQMILNITYNFLLVTRSGNFIFTHFEAISRFDCSQYALKMIFREKVFKLEASNFTEMFDGSLSTTFAKTVWRFLHIDGSQIKKYVKKMRFLAIFLRMRHQFWLKFHILIVLNSADFLSHSHTHVLLTTNAGKVVTPFSSINSTYSLTHPLTFSTTHILSLLSNFRRVHIQLAYFNLLVSIEFQ